ncbi:nucleoside hydrolase [Williamsia deligens]|uniref:Nucleoside hydrolase n=1 Tax=Williamsia deligens TaxID=321325 RepID=A0ABW3GAR6_9NOCA|nr:nucleoside hydrolase [Williamsia deligens]MCP2195243.1 Inosine-uridine nucleoside N-ribohydrolase [Williamsia deligens]
MVTPVPVLLDCDTGIDDSLAILYLLSHPSAELGPVVSTAGNVPADVVCANNLAWMSLCGRDDIEVCLGEVSPLVAPLRTTEDTHGPLGVGYAELPPGVTTASSRSGVDAWIETTAARPGEIVGLVTGPLTTLARAIQADPGLPTRLRRLVIMGGAFGHPGNTTPTSEWNVAVDPEAAKVVFAAFGVDGAPEPIVCPLDLTESIVFTPDHLGRLAAAAGSEPVEQPTPEDDHGTRSVASNVVVRHVVDAVRFYFEFHADHDEGYIAHMHDPFAAAVALDPAIVGTRAAVVDVEIDGTLTRGTTVADTRGMWGRPVNARIAESTDADAVLDDIVDRIAELALRVQARIDDQPGGLRP